MTDDAIALECARRAERYVAQASEALRHLEYMTARLDGMQCAVRPALTELAASVCDEGRYLAARRAVTDLHALTTQMLEAIGHIGQAAEFARLQRAAYDTRLADLRVLHAARDIAESQMYGGVPLAVSHPLSPESNGC